MRYIICGIGVISILIIEITALCQGMDGTMLAASVSGIGFICGHTVGKYQIKRSEDNADE